MTPLDFFLNLPASQDSGRKVGLTSVCSAHPIVIEAGLTEAIEAGQIPCIEATCNQVNQDGGYTGMTPKDFRHLVLSIAEKIDIKASEILLGGDHLGPNPWKNLPADEAMEKALIMSRAYGAAGFSKIHLDASMSCKDDPRTLPAAEISNRAARLAKEAEEGAVEGGHPPPGYIIGTEVPVPGGAAEALDHVMVTKSGDADVTIALHVEAFCALGLKHVLKRVVALVVQPGVEFGQTDLHHFDRPAAKELSTWRSARGEIVFEAHSTDYQSPEALMHLVQDGFAILKVGPGLTFALREGFYGLDCIASDLDVEYASGTLPNAMETVMLANPQFWQPYVDGDEDSQKHQRHEGLSDRIRYLWPDPEAVAAVEKLMAVFGAQKIPVELIEKHLPALGVQQSMSAPSVLRVAVRQALSGYTKACAGLSSES